MNIAFLCPSLSRTSGGIFEIERRLAQSLALIPDTHLKVFGPTDEYSDADLHFWQPLKPKCFAYTGPKSFRYSSTLRDSFLSTTADVAHLHALWMYNSILIHHWGQKASRPYVVTPNGMLEPWALRNSGWKKRFAGLLYERRMLSKAACIQANTYKEATDIRAYGLKNPIAIIPNGVDLPDLSKVQSVVNKAPSTYHFAAGRKVLLYLGRIHPKKGLANLLRAWAVVSRKPQIGNRKSLEWVLAIAGWDQGGHEAELKRLCDELGIAWLDAREHRTSNIEPPTSNIKTECIKQKADFSVSEFQLSDFPPSVVFLGPKFGEEKAALYRDCDAFILPSLSEGLPMVVLEAWSHGKPVLMTTECNLPEGFSANAAIRIEPNAESIAQGLLELFQAPSAKRQAMGANGHQLIAEKFTWPKVAAEIKSVYEWVLGGGPKPGCIID